MHIDLEFKDVFTSVNRIYQYRTRLVSKKLYYLLKVRTNYEEFNSTFHLLRNYVLLQYRSQSACYETKCKVEFFLFRPQMH